ncbi:hypothetical protein GCM10010315_06500 [Streptomyces luteosporeus]|uniref:Uncharacterized protein n=1 Tax=Streptomyces luteosporeus TaxID=173856 RepID=A0ABN3TLV5_9ACTN
MTEEPEGLIPTSTDFPHTLWTMKWSHSFLWTTPWAAHSGRLSGNSGVYRHHAAHKPQGFFRLPRIPFIHVTRFGQIAIKRNIASSGGGPRR